jgi:hypothetical protein
LNSRFELTVKAIQIKQTYSGILAGEPTLEDNMRVYDRIPCPSDWFTARCVMKDSVFKLTEPFRKFIVWIWFESDKTVKKRNSKFDYSELTVIYTVDSIQDFSIQNLIDRGFEKFQWEKYAEDIII